MNKLRQFVDKHAYAIFAISIMAVVISLAVFSVVFEYDVSKDMKDDIQYVTEHTECGWNDKHEFCMCVTFITKGRNSVFAVDKEVCENLGD